jgi:predicted 3-demethylubiquinone-9 3-methyltransferase (glyoxalase superfamily)
MQKITPFLWFDGQAEEAARFYTSVFRDSKMGAITRFGRAGPGKPGSVLCVEFRLHGQKFVALNGGPNFRITPAISFCVYCKTQREVDGLWSRLLPGGKEMQCGWLTDKFGLAWQIIPEILPKLLGDKNPAKSERVMKALLQMVKMDIKTLRKAHERE